MIISWKIEAKRSGRKVTFLRLLYRISYRYGFIMSSTNKAYQPHLMLLLYPRIFHNWVFYFSISENCYFTRKETSFRYFFFFNMKSFLLFNFGGHVTQLGKLSERFQEIPTSTWNLDHALRDEWKISNLILLVSCFVIEKAHKWRLKFELKRIKIQTFRAIEKYRKKFYAKTWRVERWNWFFPQPLSHFPSIFHIWRNVAKLNDEAQVQVFVVGRKKELRKNFSSYTRFQCSSCISM